MRTFSFSNNRLINTAALIAAALSLATVWCFTILNNGSYTRVYNADTLHPFLLANDMLANLGSYFDWFHPPALFLLPDLPLATVSILAGASGSQQPVVYATLVLFLSCAVVGLILNTVRGVNLIHAVIFAISIYTFIFLLSLTGNFNGVGSTAVAFLGSPYVRSGAVLSALFALWLLSKFLFYGKYLTFLVLFSSVMVFSDPIFIVFFCVPAIGVLILKALIERNLYTTIPPTLLGISTLLAFYLELTVHHTRDNSNYLSSDRTYFESLMNLLDRELGAILSGDMLWVSLFCFSLLLLISSIISFYKLAFNRCSKAQSRMHYLNIFFGAAVVVVYLAPLILKRDHSVTEVRYILVLIPYVFVWVALNTVPMLENLFKLNSFVGIATFFVIAFLTIGSTITSVAKLVKPDPVISCLLNLGLSAGLSDYWNSKNLMLTSDYALHIVAIRPEGHPFLWNTNKRWYEMRVDENRPAVFDFYLFKPNGESGAADIFATSFGQPNEVAECGSYSVWIYDKPLMNNDS